MDKAMFLDTLIFLGINLIFIFFIAKKNINIKSKIVYFLIFLTFNSSYNIMIKRIHDFNLGIPRNFIWTTKVISSFSIYDMIFVILLCINLPYLMEILRKDRFIRINYVRDLIIICIGTISFIIFKGYWLDNGRNYLITMKGLIYFSATLTITLKYLQQELNPKNYLVPITLILFSGYLSLMFFPREELWIRYGQIVKILDQEDAYTISLFAITYLLVYLFYPEKTRKKPHLIFLLVIFITILTQNALSIYKTNFIYYLYLLLVLPVIQLTKRLFIKWYSILTFVLITIILGMGIIINVSNSQSISTRTNQIEDYLNYINKNYKSAYLIGSGIGTPYESLPEAGDFGEIKKIDLENSSNINYKFTFQIPILFIFKYAGIIGVLWFLFFWGLIIFKVYKDIKITRSSSLSLSQKVELASIGIYLVYFSIFWGSVMLGGTTPFFIFLGFLVGRYSILRRKLYQYK